MEASKSFHYSVKPLNKCLTIFYPQREDLVQDWSKWHAIFEFLKRTRKNSRTPTASPRDPPPPQMTMFSPFKSMELATACVSLPSAKKNKSARAHVGKTRHPRDIKRRVCDPPLVSRRVYLAAASRDTRREEEKARFWGIIFEKVDTHGDAFGWFDEFWVVGHRAVCIGHRKLVSFFCSHSSVMMCFCWRPALLYREASSRGLFSYLLGGLALAAHFFAIYIMPWSTVFLLWAASG